ncbi:MAG: hypothetical protein HOP22_08245 [Nitrospiraceae bacterium]|nr:hypothetical protein [Nitrospiraceae bacterium]
MKTLVLKASAKEELGEEYKVHLVPCFSSHIESANNLFRARFGGNDVGGLLHWIGQREQLVDYDMVSAADDVVKKRVESFSLTSLAALLRCPISPATP